MTGMAGDVSQGTASPDWYKDPMGRHQYRYWDGAAWTQDVADSGHASIDPLEGSGVDQAAGAAAGEPGGERVLLVLPMSTDVTWGGFMNLYLTDRRIVVEKVMGSAAGAVLAGGIAGGAIATNIARGRSDLALGQQRTPAEVLQASTSNYAVDYDAIARVRLTRKALPVGYSRCKIASSQKNVTLAFKRESFDDAARVMSQVLSDRVEVK
jgi:hypothetical protein